MDIKEVLKWMQARTHPERGSISSSLWSRVKTEICQSHFHALFS
jgi:hypothetical protein